MTATTRMSLWHILDRLQKMSEPLKHTLAELTLGKVVSKSTWSITNFYGLIIKKYEQKIYYENGSIISKLL